MNTTAANQADRQIELVSEDPLGNTQARWSTDDELLVWTVSRIEGGRRHGVERDCHVVYALSRGFFVEQTRKFRASAEQCIEMLQQGKRAGTIQRKIALDSIIALKSDPRSGRLQIRTLNGTHQIEPVSNEEADVLRQIGGELALRMPAGGASFSDYSGPSHTERRRAQEAAASVSDLAERERHSLAAVENARVEDAPDAYVAPDYAGADVTDLSNPESTVADTAMSAQELQRIAAAVHAEMGPGNEPVPELPTDITVAGGVDITFSPAADYAASADVPVEHVAAEYAEHAEHAEHVATEHVATEHVAAEHVAAEHHEGAYSGADYPEADYIAADPTVAEVLTPEAVESQYSTAGYQAAEYVAHAEAAPASSTMDQAAPQYALAEHDITDSRGGFAPAPAEYVSAEPLAEYPVEQAAPALFDTPDIADPGAHDSPDQEVEPAEDFDRRQQRAIRRQVDGESMDTNHTVSPSLFPVDPGIELPAGAVFEPVEAESTHHESATVSDDEAHLHLATPAPPVAFSAEPHTVAADENQRHVEDPNAPSVFDRRGAHPVVPEERPGWARFDDENNDVVANELGSDEHRQDLSPALSADPPTLIAPTGGQAIGSGGAVGFNPDFDINPFR